MFFQTPLCPEACFERMELDKYSRCTPRKPTPSGVESSDPIRKQTQPYKVGAWNRARDEELRRLESFARDGLRVSNAHLLAAAHLQKSLESPGKALPEEERQYTAAVLRDLSHTIKDHFVRIAEQSVLSRRAIATMALNIEDVSKLMIAPLGKDLFGGAWQSVADADSARRKRKAEEAALRTRESKPKRTRGRGLSQLTRGRGARPQAMPTPQVQQYPHPHTLSIPPLMQFALPAPLQNPPQMTPQSTQKRGGGKRNRRDSNRRGRGRGKGPQANRPRDGPSGTFHPYQGQSQF